MEISRWLLISVHIAAIENISGPNELSRVSRNKLACHELGVEKVIC